MTRLQAVILTAVLALAGCIDDGLDADESTDHPWCSPMEASIYCDLPVEDVDMEEMEVKNVPRHHDDDVVFLIEGYGAYWVARQRWVCLDACE